MTVVQGEDVKIEVELKGPIPARASLTPPGCGSGPIRKPPTTLKNGLLNKARTAREIWKLTIPAKQIRSGGFRYKLLVGKVQTQT